HSAKIAQTRRNSSIQRVPRKEPRHPLQWTRRFNDAFSRLPDRPFSLLRLGVRLGLGIPQERSRLERNVSALEEGFRFEPHLEKREPEPLPRRKALGIPC